MFHVHLSRRCTLLHSNGMSWRYQWESSHLMYHLRHVSLLIFCFDDLSTGVSGILSLLLLLCYCQFLFSCLLVFVLCIEVLLCWVHRYLQLFYLPLGLIPYHYLVPLLISCNLYFKVYFVWYEDYYSSFLLFPIGMKYIFPSSHFQSIGVLKSEWFSCRQHIYGSYFLYPSSQSVSFGWNI